MIIECVCVVRCVCVMYGIHLVVFVCLSVCVCSLCVRARRLVKIEGAWVSARCACCLDAIDAAGSLKERQRARACKYEGTCEEHSDYNVLFDERG